MRGEEVEILGVAEAGARLVVLPGSHSKWAVVEGGRVARFKTFVTGEAFAAIRDHTLVGAFARAAPPRPPGAAFSLAASGAAHPPVRGEGGDGLLGALFSARSLPLMGKLAEADAGEYLSGLLDRRRDRRGAPAVFRRAGACRRSERARCALSRRIRRARRRGLGCAASGRRARTARRRPSSRTSAMIALSPTPLIAILRGVKPDEAEAIGAVLVEAGFGGIEVPFNSPEPLKSIAILADKFGRATLVGAGTVLLPGAAESAAGAGAALIVAPNADPAVIETALKLGLRVLPGVATPSEAFAALSLGATGLKMFPAEAMPPEVVKAWRSVLPKDAPLFPVGGITPKRSRPTAQPAPTASASAARSTSRG